jgi:hypothetical protein
MYACVCCVSLIKNSMHGAWLCVLLSRTVADTTSCMYNDSEQFWLSKAEKYISFYKYTFIIIIMVYNHLSLYIYLKEY